MKKVIVFDLDNTLAESKSPITPEMAVKLSALLNKYDIGIISGGKFEQFKTQIIDRLKVDPRLLPKLHIMPTCGTRYYRYQNGDWVIQYAEDFSDAEKQKIINQLEKTAKELGFWETKTYGEIIEDRGSQVTYSALGQQAPPAAKYAWDPDDAKKNAIREHAGAMLQEFEVRVGGTTSIDVTKPGIDKAYGMEKLMKIEGFEKSDILFIGDRLDEGGNDYPVKSIGIDCIEVTDYRATPAEIDKLLQPAS